MTKPITPSEILVRKAGQIPAEVIDVVNELLVLKCDPNGRARATILQKEVVEALVERGFDKGEIYEKRWLDFEPLFREHGWVVKYDKPGYNETYEARWEFTARQITRYEK